MKGLLLKDLYTMKKQLYVAGGLMVFYLVYAIVLKNAMMLGTAVVLFSFLMPITCMAYDDASGWNRYALSLPLTRKKLVLTKYLVGVITTVAGFALAMVGNAALIAMGYVDNPTETWVFTCIFAEVGLLILSLMLPVMFKFGAEKGRFILIAMIMIPTVLGGFIFSWLQTLGISAPSDETVILIVALSPIFVLAVMGLSYLLSVKIVNKKEY